MFGHLLTIPATIADDILADDLPPALQLSLARHRDNLSSMMAALRAAGLNETSIEAHLGLLINSYRAELSTALHHLSLKELRDAA